YTLSCADGDRAWFIDRDGLSAVAAGTITRIPSIAGVRPYEMRHVVAASDHTLYTSVLTPRAIAGIWRYKDRQWARLPGEGALGAQGLMLYLDSQDRLWTGWTDGQVIMHAGERAQVFASGLPGLGWIFALLETSRGFFAA